MTVVRISVQKRFTTPRRNALVGGQDNPIYPIVQYLNDITPDGRRDPGEGRDSNRSVRYWRGNRYIYETDVELEHLTLAVCQTLIASNCIVRDYPAYAKIVASDPIPGGTDTWTEFFEATPTRSPVTVRTAQGVDWYVSSGVFQNRPLPLHDAIAMFGADNLVSQFTLDALVANQPPEPDPEPDPE